MKLIGAFFVLVSLTGCGNKWEPAGNFPSPDGQYIASFEYKGSAACCSDHLRMTMKNGKVGMLDEPVLAIEATNTRRPKVFWESSRLIVVELCGATEFEIKSRIYHGGNVDDDAIRVEAITADDVERNGKQYCLG
ncbi:MAG: hypothetical protein ACK519_11100 [Sphingomonadaceae bacterium]|jgi:hypothetical protein